MRYLRDSAFWNFFSLGRRAERRRILAGLKEIAYWGDYNQELVVLRDVEELVKGGKK